MTLYEKLDLIADSYNPFLLLVSIVVLVVIFKNQGRKTGFYSLGLLVSLITLVYVSLFVDSYFHIWGSFGLDYSTHTAFSLALVFFVLNYNTDMGKSTTRTNDVKLSLTQSLFDQMTAFKVFILVSFVSYLILMIYQEYHTIADLLTTIIVVGPLMYVSIYLVNRRLTL